MTAFSMACGGFPDGTSLLVDTSARFAYANRSDRDHSSGRNVLRTFEGRRVPSNLVFDKTVTLCRYRLGHGIAASIGGVLLDAVGLDLIRITPEDEREAWELFLARPDQTYSFTDCTSFVLMRRLRLHRVIALDEDFQREGFELLPSP